MRANTDIRHWVIIRFHLFSAILNYSSVSWSRGRLKRKSANGRRDPGPTLSSERRDRDEVLTRQNVSDDQRMGRSVSSGEDHKLNPPIYYGASVDENKSDGRRRSHLRLPATLKTAISAIIITDVLLTANNQSNSG